MLVILVAAVVTATSTSAPQVVQADVYFMAWSTLTRVNQAPADIRAHPDVAIRTIDPACLKSVVATLRLDVLAKAEPDGGQGDARLVIDLRDARGKTATYYADRFELMSEDGALRRPIDQRFQDIMGTRLFLGEAKWCASLSRPGT
jgi:hypothetical protein